MSTALFEKTKADVQLNDDEMFDAFREAYDTSLDHRDEWREFPRGFESPVFKYPRPAAIRKGRAKLLVFPQTIVYPTAIAIFGESQKLKQQPYLREPAYEATLPSVDSDGAFNIQKGWSRQDQRAFGVPIEEGKLIEEGNPERLIIQRIISSALEQFSGN